MKANNKQKTQQDASVSKAVAKVIFPIRFKIVTISITALVFLGIIIGLTSYQLMKIKAELHEIGYIMEPLTEKLHNLNIHVLQQELISEQIFKHYAAKKLEKEYIIKNEKLVKEYEHLAIEFEKDLQALDELFKKANVEVKIEENRLFYKEYDKALVELGEAYHQIETQSRIIFALLQLGQKKIALSLEKKIDLSQQDFNAHIHHLFNKLEERLIEKVEVTEKEEQQVLLICIVLTIISLVMGVTISLFFTKELLRPLKLLAANIQQVGKGDFNQKLLTAGGNDEIFLLSHQFDKMTSDLKTKAKIEETFGKYIDPRLAEKLLSGSVGKQGGEKKNMCVLFCSLKPLDDLNIHLPPDEYSVFYNEYLNLLVAPIDNHNGIIDKFIGMTMMAFWGEPFNEQANMPKDVFEAMCNQINQLATLKQKVTQWLKGQVKDVKLNLSMGLVYGTVVAGNMGSESSKAYTVMGDTVNIASRLKGATKFYGVTNLMNEQTKDFLQQHPNAFFRKIDKVYLVGKDEPAELYELIVNADANTKKIVESYHRAWQQYAKRNWNDATHLLDKILHIDATDSPTKLLKARIQDYQKNPPPPTWNATWRLSSK